MRTASGKEGKQMEDQQISHWLPLHSSARNSSVILIILATVMGFIFLNFFLGINKDNNLLNTSEE